LVMYHKLLEKEQKSITNVADEKKVFKLGQKFVKLVHIRFILFVWYKLLL
jgi:hypothetical protein